MSDLPRSVLAFIIALCAAAVGALAAAAQYDDPLDPQQATLAIGFGLALVVTLLFPLPFAHRSRIYLDTSAMLATVLLFPPLVAIVLAAASTCVANILQRHPPSEIIFNTSQFALRAASGSFALWWLGWDYDNASLESISDVGVVVIAAIVMHLVNTVCLAIIIGLQEGQSPLGVWYHVLANVDRAEGMTYVGEVGIAMLAVLLVNTSPWALLLLIFPFAGVYASLDRHVKIRRYVEERLFGAERNLSEAQRIAQLGSFEWDAETNVVTFSDEMFRILGHDPQATAPSGDLLLSAVHPDDRHDVDRAFADALSGHSELNIDLRLVRPDGSTRFVHAQAEPRREERGAVVGLIGAVYDITERKQFEDALAQQANHDALTGLPNRRLFMKRLAQVIARPAPRTDLIAVLFLDLDRFKVINDALGHDAGDELLVAVARRLENCLRPGDIVARLAGDEFTILLKDLSDREAAEQVARRVISALAAPFSLRGHATHVTTSIGIAIDESQRATAADLLRDADLALYRAKGSGRAGYAVYEPGMVRAADAPDLASELLLAIERREIDATYHPIVDLTSGKVQSVEAVMNWNHPSRGNIAQSALLSTADENELSVFLGRWILDMACHQADAWQSHLTAPVTVSVNIAPGYLAHPGFADDVLSVLERSGIDPGQLQLEVSELSLDANDDTTLSALFPLAELGIRVAIDDFGARRASLVDLRRLPIDAVKLSRSLVSSLAAEREARTLAEAVIQFASSLGLTVIAEGVEHETQSDLLRQLGCEFGQGDLFSAPLAAHEALFVMKHGTRVTDAAATAS